MQAHVSELLHLIARWVHLIAGIMWIGNSMLFNWLDRNLELPADAKKGLIGEIWMVHSGGFYQVEKKFLSPGQMPKTLHWFKWQNGITWLSGMALLVLVYHMGGAALMADGASVPKGQAIGIGMGSIVAGWVLYDLIWRSPLKKSPNVGFALSLAMIAGLSAVLFRYLGGRAAYIHIGVMIGTIMTGNVWFVIIPSQKELVAATLEGREQSPEIGYQAKQRSIHNNYFTFPLLFIMLSNHFPTTYGHALNWAVLLVLAVGSALIRHFMNIRFTYRGWLLPTTLVFFATCAAMLFFFSRPTGFAKPVNVATTDGSLHWSDVATIVRDRCQPCHSSHPTNAAFPVAPNGLMFDSPEQVSRQSERVKLRAVTLKNMPLGNMTQMTDAERDKLGAWLDRGAPN